MIEIDGGRLANVCGGAPAELPLLAFRLVTKNKKIVGEIFHRETALREGTNAIGRIKIGRHWVDVEQLIPQWVHKPPTDFRP